VGGALAGVLRSREVEEEQLSRTRAGRGIRMVATRHPMAWVEVEAAVREVVVVVVAWVVWVVRVVPVVLVVKAGGRLGIGVMR